jgi:hydroxyacylglutathione hydrolase
MTIYPIKAFHDNYIWCLVKNSDCLIVDPGEASPVTQFLQKNKLNLKAILATHHHFDHTNGITELVQTKSVPVYGSAQIPEVTHVVHDEEIIHPLEIPFKVLTIPAHTLEHVAYYSDGVAFTGDTLFTAGCGKIFEGNAEQMYESLNKLKHLPTDTLIYCGHEYTLNNLRFAHLVEPNNQAIQERIEITKQLIKEGQPAVPAPLKLELETNPFLRCNQKEVIIAASDYAQKSLTDPVEILFTLREWKNSLM